MVLSSRNIHYVVVKLIILLLLSTTSLKAEDYSWSIKKINEKNVMVSMNGQIQHCDRLYFYIPSANCNRVENLFQNILFSVIFKDGLAIKMISANGEGR